MYYEQTLFIFQLHTGNSRNGSGYQQPVNQSLTLVICNMYTSIIDACRLYDFIEHFGSFSNTNFETVRTSQLFGKRLEIGTAVKGTISEIFYFV